MLARMKITREDSAALLPCPYCDNDDLGIATDRAGATVVCLECGASGPIATPGSPLRQAQARWNSRTRRELPRAGRVSVHWQ